MKTLFGVALVMVILFWTIRYRPAAAIVGFFIIFSLVTRTLALAYVDLAGPVYAIELLDWVGGDQSMLLFASSVCLFLIPLAVLFRPSELNRLLPPKKNQLHVNQRSSKIIFVMLAIYLFVLFVNLLMVGSIPLFSDIDRLEYHKTAGFLHAGVMKNWFWLSGIMSIMMVVPRLTGSDFNLRYLGLFVCLLVYFALSGNRFSVFYASFGFFLIPFGAVSALSSAKLLKPIRLQRSAVSILITSNKVKNLALIIFSFVIAALVANNIINVRAYGDPIDQFIQRSLIQPVQLYWTTWRDLDSREMFVNEIWSWVFFDPIVPDKNTSIQALMAKNIGVQRTAELLSFGQQYGGGYPEILFELFGIYGGLLVGLIFGLISSWLLRFIVVSVAYCRVLTSLIAIYVFYSVSVLYIGGMLNFLLVWIFWVKTCVLIFSHIYESRIYQRQFQALKPALRNCGVII